MSEEATAKRTPVTTATDSLELHLRRLREERAIMDRLAYLATNNRPTLRSKEELAELELEVSAAKIFLEHFRGTKK